VTSATIREVREINESPEAREVPEVHEVHEVHGSREACGVRECNPATPGVGTGDGDQGGPGDTCDLYLVAGRPSPATFWRRRLAVVVGPVLVGLALLGVFGQVGASADLADRVDGHVIVEPGQTLWDIALLTAPDGVDARAHLAAIEDLNGIRADDVQAWNVILLPAR
jgi:hypothetical protein